MATSTRRPAYRALLERIVRARERSGLLQVDVARRLGRPQSWVSRLETGERRLDPIELQCLAAVLGTTVAELLPSPEETLQLEGLPVEDPESG